MLLSSSCSHFPESAQDGEARGTAKSANDCGVDGCLLLVCAASQDFLRTECCSPFPSRALYPSHTMSSLYGPSPIVLTKPCLVRMGCLMGQ